MSAPSEPLFLCVDCGGTKTAAVICDADGTIVGRGTAGPSNIAYLPVPAFLRAITDAVLRALADAKHPFGSLSPNSSDQAVSPFPSAPFHSAWFGISGADSPSAIRSVTPSLATLLHLPLDPASSTGTSSRLAVANDTHLLAAPVHDFPADGPNRVTNVVAIIGGTGSIVVSFARGGAGEGGELTELARVGGWGWILGDEGGGYDVGREALRQILSASDHAQILRANAGVSTSTSGATESTASALYPTVFTSRVLARFGVPAGGGALDAFGGVYASDPPPPAPNSSGPPSPTTTSDDDLTAYLSMPHEKRISSLPPLVFAAAFPPSHSRETQPDPLAVNILHTCAAKLGAQAAALFGLASPTNAHLQFLKNTVATELQNPNSAQILGQRSASTPILDPTHTLLTFGGSLVGVPAYRDMIVADLTARFTEQRSAMDKEVNTLFPPERVVFVEDAAAAGARGLASAWRRENGRA